MKGIVTHIGCFIGLIVTFSADLLFVHSRIILSTNLTGLMY